jgi:hypothetical protein
VTLRALLPWLKPWLIPAAVVAIVAVGECRDFRSTAREEARPTVAPPTARVERAEVVTLPCETIQTLEPTPRDRRRIAEDYNRPDLGRTVPDSGNATIPVSAESADSPKILAERELPPMPEGGTALVTLEPDGRTEVTVKPSPERLFDWRSTWEIGGLYGLGSEGDTRARGWAAVEPLRFGRLHLRAEVGVELRAGTADSYAMAGAVWRSR